MNYLAHAFLSPNDPEVLMGNLWGDLLKPADYVNLQENVLKGIVIHKGIDAYTDQHPEVNQLIALIRPYQRKYTPVVVDVLMDFILSKYWNQYHNESIEIFCKEKTGIVTSNLGLIPERLHPRIKRMLANNWLESCKDRRRIETTLYMLSQRASFENNIPEAMKPYDLHEETIDRLFLTFFEDLRAQFTLRNEG